jgi:hypothetical protein
VEALVKHGKDICKEAIVLCLHSKLNELRMGGGAFDCALLASRIQNAMVRILMKSIVDIKKNYVGGITKQLWHTCTILLEKKLG